MRDNYEYIHTISGFDKEFYKIKVRTNYISVITYK